MNEIPNPQLFEKTICLDAIRNAAPELLNNDSKATSASDIYSLGMIALEIFTEELAFAHIAGGTNLQDMGRLTRTIESGELPKRPQGNLYMERGLDDRMWELLRRCWSVKPLKRPMIDEIIAGLSIAS